jgi:hypothetical protein
MVSMADCVQMYLIKKGRGGMLRPESKQDCTA